MKARIYILILAACMFSGFANKTAGAEAEKISVEDFGSMRFKSVPAMSSYHYHHGIYFEYSARIRRFHRPFVHFSYYAPVFAETFWYSFSPFTWGISIYGNDVIGIGYSGYPVYATGYNGYYGYDYFGYSPFLYDPYVYREYSPVIVTVKVKAKKYYTWNRHYYEPVIRPYDRVFYRPPLRYCHESVRGYVYRHAPETSVLYRSTPVYRSTQAYKVSRSSSVRHAALSGRESVGYSRSENKAVTTQTATRRTTGTTAGTSRKSAARPSRATTEAAARTNRTTNNTAVYHSKRDKSQNMVTTESARRGSSWDRTGSKTARKSASDRRMKVTGTSTIKRKTSEPAVYRENQSRRPSSSVSNSNRNATHAEKSYRRQSNVRNDNTGSQAKRSSVKRTTKKSARSGVPSARTSPNRSGSTVQGSPRKASESGKSKTSRQPSVNRPSEKRQSLKTDHE